MAIRILYSEEETHNFPSNFISEIEKILSSYSVLNFTHDLILIRVIPLIKYQFYFHVEGFISLSINKVFITDKINPVFSSLNNKFKDLFSDYTFINRIKNNLHYWHFSGIYKQK